MSAMHDENVFRAPLTRTLLEVARRAHDVDVGAHLGSALGRHDQIGDVTG